MANTFELIGSTTVGSGGASSINFTSIPGTFTDLSLHLSCRSVVAGAFADTLIKFNGSVSTFTNKYIYGNGANALTGTNAYSGSGGYIGGMTGGTSTANTFNNNIIYIYMSIHTFGDSHSYNGWSGVIQHHLGPLLCYSFGKEKLNRCDIRNFNINDGDTIIFV
jgi:hypothetical protein